MITGAAATASSTAQHFDVAEFDEAIASNGTSALWRRSIVCPCRDPRTHQASLDCSVCENGLIWDDGQPVRLFAFNRKRNDIYDVPGQRLEGATQFTFPSNIVPGHLDMLILLIGQMVVNNELHVRGELDNAGRSTERLRVRPAYAVEFVYSVNAGVLQSYELGADLTINDDGDIAWVAGRGPADGQTYSMRYRARPTYVAWSPYGRDEGGQVMPHRTLALRYDFFDPKAVGEN